MFKIKTVGLDKTLANLGKVSKGITKAKSNSQKQAGDFAWTLARENVPVDEGNVREMIVVNHSDFNSVVTSFPPTNAGDLESKRFGTRIDPAKPNLNVLLEEGNLAQLNWGGTIKPKSGDFHFMLRSVEPTEQEFIRLLNLEINEVTK